MKSALLKKLMVSFLAASTVITGSALGTLNAEAASSKVRVWVIDSIENKDESKIQSTLGSENESSYTYEYNDKGLVTKIKGSKYSLKYSRVGEPYVPVTTTAKYNDANELVYIKSTSKKDSAFNSNTDLKVVSKFDMSDGTHDIPFVNKNVEGFVFEYSYIAKGGKVIQFNENHNGNPGAVTKYSYNKRGDLSKVVFSEGSPLKIKNVYDNNGNLKKRKFTGENYLYQTSTGKRSDLIVVQTIKYKEIEVEKNMVDTVKAYQWALLNDNLNCAFPKIIVANPKFGGDEDVNICAYWWCSSYSIWK